jgi:RimJ/RimL family protein N-acetyltransferase
MKKERPTLTTERLILRPFVLNDAPEVHRLVNEEDIAKTTLNIPHPYEEGMAEAWIKAQQARFEQGEAINFAVTLREGGTLLGTISLHPNPTHLHAEMGYWIGQPYWGQGYCTEGVRAVIKYAFETMGFNRIYAAHFKSNPASGRVMQKAGMMYEGCLRQHLRKWGEFEDVIRYGILREEFYA